MLKWKSNKDFVKILGIFSIFGKYAIYLYTAIFHIFIYICYIKKTICNNQKNFVTDYCTNDGKLFIDHNHKHKYIFIEWRYLMRKNRNNNIHYYFFC